VRSRACIWLSVLGLLAAIPVRGERLTLESPAAAGRSVNAGVMKPFDVFLVAERDSGKTQLSAVAYKLHVPDGLVMAGEQVLVESIIGLGNSREGLNLVFRCTDNPRQTVVHFRFLATKPLQGAVLGLGPESRTNFLGVVSCRDEVFAKFETAPDSLIIDAK
jgi:hypothetical protein